MIRSILALALVIGVFSSAASPAPPAKPLWRLDLSHLDADRALVRRCLEQDLNKLANCQANVQAACLAGLTNEEHIPAAERRCDWRAIAAWENEMAASLAALQPMLTAHDRANLKASQTAWQAAMLANVALIMGVYSGGSLSAQAGAHARAEAVSSRVIFLERFHRMLDGR